MERFKPATAFFLILGLVLAGSISKADKPSTRPADFKVFDNLHTPKKPDLASEGLIHCNIIYSGYVWPGAEKSPDFGKMPEEAAYKEAVKQHAKLDGPVVLDFETLRLSGKPDVVEPHFKLFITLVKWTKEAMPGHIVGYYGHGLFPEVPGKEYTKQTAELADAVDAFFPSMYTFNEDRQAWKKKATGLLELAHKTSPGKPVYFYIWPQFHEGTHELLSGDQWAFELKTAKELGADGVVLWSGSAAPKWDATAPWWVATQAFLKQ